MKPISGLNRDVNPIDQPKDTMRYAANGIISESTGLAQNIRDELQWDNLDSDFKFIGQSTGDHDIYIFGYNLTQGEIWRYNPEVSNSKDLLIIDPGNVLDFDLEAASDKVLQIVYQQDFADHEIFAWAGQTKPKIIDIGLILNNAGYDESNPHVPGDPAVDLSVEGYSEEEFFLFPEGELFNPESTALNSGGSVLSGAWMWAYRYVFSDNSVTSFSGVGNPVYITEDSFEKRDAFQGGPGDRPTTKSIKIDFFHDQNLNPEVIRVEFGYISIRDGVIFSGILSPKGLSGLIKSADTASYVYTGELPQIDLGDNISEIITPKANYTNIETLTSLTSRLYAGNLTTRDDINIQNIANAITSSWSVAISTYDKKGELANNATFGAGEIYALYISVLYDNGQESRAFHIPGRKFVAGDDDPIISAAHEKWELFDTATGVATGATGYWINKEELYPNQTEFDSAKDPGISPYPDNVRHHKMPSLGYLIANGALVQPFNQSAQISITLDNVDLSSLGSDVIGYNIYYAKRKIGEFVNLSYEFPVPAGSYPVEASSRVAISSPYAFSDADPIDAVDPLLDVIPDDNIMRFHSLFLLDNRPAINPLYFVKEGRSSETTTFAELVVDSDKYTNLAGTPDVTLGSAYKYGVIIRGALTLDFFAEEDRYVKIEDFAYIKNGVKWSFTNHSFDNNAGEDCFAVYSTSGFDGVAGTEVIFTPISRFGNRGISMSTYAALRTIPENIAISFDSQTLIFTKSFKREDTVSETAIIESRHGDVFNGLHQFNTTGVAGMGPDELAAGRALIDTTTDEAGVFKGESSKMVYILPCQSPINHNTQYSDPSDVQSYIYRIHGSIGGGSPLGTVLPYNQQTLAKLKTWYFYDQNIYTSFNLFYNDDFHRYSEYFISGINDGYFVENSKLPTTIAFSLQQPTSVQIRQWRNWLLLNKYVQPSEKGEIINLKGAGNQMLYIHHRYSLYTTKDRISMQTSSTSVIIGSSDIFEVTPYEIVSVDEGHTGLRNRNWHSLTPFGYSWIQTDHGKIYTHNGKELKELSGMGMRTYFRDFLFDNDNKDEACFIINDDLRRRLIVGFRHDRIDDESGRTIAYSTSSEKWTFFQDMESIFPIVARDKRVFIWGKGVNDHAIYAVAEGAYDNAKRPFIIEVVMNDGTSDHKYLQYLKWNTNVFSANIDQSEDTFNKLVIYSDSKIYGNPGVAADYWDANLIPYTGFPKTNENARRLEDNWSTNDFRDLAIENINILVDTVDNDGPNSAAIDPLLTWDNKGRMRDKYLLIRLYYEKPNGSKIEFENVQFGIKPSFR